MPEIRLVNDSGYDALLTLAGSEPQLFVQGNAEELRRRMERAGRVEHGSNAELYGEQLVMPVLLADLNRLQKDGPSSDAEYAPAMRQAAGSSVVQSADRLLWTTINCFMLPQYVPVRWGSSNLTQATENFVRRHWLQYSGSDGRKWNAAARLWWLSEMATRAAEYSQHSEGELLAAMSGNVQMYHQTIDRTFLSSNPRLLAAIWDVFLDGNDYLDNNTVASDLMKALNLRAATLSFDFLDYDELRDVVEEAKPPKGP